MNPTLYMIVDLIFAWPRCCFWYDFIAGLPQIFITPSAKRW